MMKLGTQSEPVPRYFCWPLAAGLLFALWSLAVLPLLGLEVSGPFDRKPGGLTWPAVFVGVFVCGWLSWWVLMPGWRRVSPLAGALAGVLAGSASFPVVFGLAELANYFWSTPPTAQAGGLGRVVWITGLSLMTIGLPSAVTMAFVGLVGARVLLAIAPTQDTPGNASTNGFARGWSRRLALGTALVLAGVLTVPLVLLSVRPVSVDGLRERPSPTTPTQTHEQAVAAFAAVRLAEADTGLHERCPSQLLSHGHKTELAVIFFHGLTSCPAQGEEFGRSVFDLGYNVYLPRMFGHGEADPDTLALADLTAEHLVDLANSATDLAQGLGDEVIVVGLSAGGTIAVWLAQHRPDIDHAIPVSPFLGPYVVPPWATRTATNLVLSTPNMVFWVNPLAPVTAPDTEYPFPRPSTHTLAQVMRLGQAVMTDAAQDLLLSEISPFFSMTPMSR